MPGSMTPGVGGATVAIMDVPFLNLAKALAAGRLEDFIRQEEAAGRVVDRDDFDRRLGSLIKAPPPEGRTSRSRARGGLRGTRTH